jgi:hypothetical protein
MPKILPKAPMLRTVVGDDVFHTALRKVGGAEAERVIREYVMGNPEKSEKWSGALRASLQDAGALGHALDTIGARDVNAAGRMKALGDVVNTLKPDQATKLLQAMATNPNADPYTVVSQILTAQGG